MMVICRTGGLLSTNCYIVACEGTMEAMVIDPGFGEGECEDILREVSAHGLKVKYVVNTHGHPDHTSCNRMLRQATGAEILIHKDDVHMLVEPMELGRRMMETQTFRICPNCGKRRVRLMVLKEEGRAALRCDACGTITEAVVPLPADRLLRHGDIIRVGELELRVIHTPGHSQGGISLYCENEDVVFTGDTLFRLSVGRTDLPGSSTEDIMRSLRDKLMKLPDRTVVYPGHGEKTTIGREKRENPFVQT